MEPWCFIERCGRPAELQDACTGDLVCLDHWAEMVQAGEVDESDYYVIEET
jgi:hypothetical protein